MQKKIQPGPTIDHSTYLGGSDIGPVAGVGEFKTQLDVWAEKKGKTNFKSNVHTRIGNAFERPALQLYLEDNGGGILKYPGTLLSEKYPFFGATPDAIHDKAIPELVECKIIGFNTRYKWGKPEEGPEGVPPETVCQVHWQAWIYNELHPIKPIEVAKVPAFFGTVFNTYEVPIDRELTELLIDQGHDFWQKHVVADVMPRVEQDSTEILRAIYPRNLSEEPEPMNMEVADLAEQYLELIGDRDQAVAELDVVKSRLQALIGDGAGYIGDGLKVTWKNNSRGKPDWKNIAVRCGARLSAFIYDQIKRENTPDIGARVLRVTRKK